VKRTLRLEIVAGDTTCASALGLSCLYMQFSPRVIWCAAFGNKTLREADGWVQRLPECIAAEVPRG